MNLGLTDIVALAKAGYKKKDIDSILIGEANKPEPVKTESAPVPEPEVKQEVTASDPDPVPAPETEPEVQKEQEPDYKSLYESLKAEGLKQAQTIKDLQNKINNQDRTIKTSDPMDDLMKSFRSFS